MKSTKKIIVYSEILTFILRALRALRVLRGSEIENEPQPKKGSSCQSGLIGSLDRINGILRITGFVSAKILFILLIL